jgi:hypothetical protein
MDNYKPVNFLFIILLAAFNQGCVLTEGNSTKAVLFVDKDKNDTHRVVQDKDEFYYGSNPVFIATDSKFSISLNKIFPGWIKQNKNVDDKNSGISYHTKNHLRGKELWLLTTIKSIDVSDPLEVNSKVYFKASNVKFDSESFSLVPIDTDERNIFTHESDSSYRVSFQLYEVDGVSLKREILKITQNPGVIGAVLALGTTLKSTVGAIAGDVIVNKFKEFTNEPLAFERLLLKLGATEEFNGQFTVLRSGSFEEMNGNSNDKSLITNKYALIDLYKDKLDSINPQSFNTKEKYINELINVRSCVYKFKGGLKNKQDDAKKGKEPAACNPYKQTAFLEFNVTYSRSERLFFDEEQKKYTLTGILQDINNKEHELEKNKTRYETLKVYGSEKDKLTKEKNNLEAELKSILNGIDTQKKLQTQQIDRLNKYSISIDEGKNESADLEKERKESNSKLNNINDEIEEFEAKQKEIVSKIHIINDIIQLTKEEKENILKITFETISSDKDKLQELRNHLKLKND